MGGPEFDFYEVVTVVDNATTRELGIDGAEGFVLGMSQNEDTGAYRFAIVIADEEGVMLDPQDLQKTGRWTSEEEYFDGTRMGVSPEGEVRWVAEPGQEPPPVVDP